MCFTKPKLKKLILNLCYYVVDLFLIKVYLKYERKLKNKVNYLIPV